jgi:hypothetical protein
LRTLSTAESSGSSRRAAFLVAGAMAATFLLLRLWLGARPDADFDVAGFNIHHLFTGVLLVTLSAIPLAIGVQSGRPRDALVLTLGAGLGLVLDEWVYLIATDGTNASYLLPVSFWGGVVMIGGAVIYAVLLGFVLRR